MQKGTRKEDGGRRQEGKDGKDGKEVKEGEWREGGREEGRKEERGRRKEDESLMERKMSILLSRLRTMETYSGYCNKKDQYMNEQRRLWSHSGALIMETEAWNHPHACQKREEKQENQEEDRKSLFGLDSFRSGIWKEVGDFGLGAVSLSDRSEALQEKDDDDDRTAEVSLVSECDGERMKTSMRLCEGGSVGEELD